MRKTVNTLRFLIVAMAFLVSAVCGYAQKQDAADVDENMLRYRYVDKESRKVRFQTPRTFAERTYIFTGTGVEGLYQIGNHPQSPGYAIGSSIGAGFWASPIHGVELALSYGMMPYGYWGENNVGAGDKFHYGVNTSFKAVYNIGTTAGLYIEPKVTFLNFEYVRPSISAGFLFRFKSADQGFEKPVDTESKKLLFALKSNALFWAAGAPNFGIEYPINNRWSICGDYVAPWSSSFATGLYYQLMMINAEGRYWFGDREERPVMTGWFAGVNLGGGYYDFMLNNQKKGLQGEFYILAGVSAGYSHSISSNDRVRLEYALGLGYMQTRYRKYHWDDFDYVLDAPREQVWKTSIFGPTQAKVSVVWLLFVNKKGGER